MEQDGDEAGLDAWGCAIHSGDVAQYIIGVLKVALLAIQGSVGDVDGTYRAMLDTWDADAVIIRPDFVLFGATRLPQLEITMAGLLQALHAKGRPVRPERVSA